MPVITWDINVRLGGSQYPLGASAVSRGNLEMWRNSTDLEKYQSRCNTWTAHVQTVVLSVKVAYQLASAEKSFNSKLKVMDKKLR